MWQELREELKSRNLEVITVAEEVKGAAGAEQFIQAANPTHPSLLDPEHRVAELYHTKNVPAVFWINEEGRIVRANDPASVLRRNRETGESTVNQAYLDGVRDWVEKGAESIYVLDGATVAARRGQRAWADVQAMAHFRLGAYLHHQGEGEAAVAQFKQAHALIPNNWNFKRQAWNLGDAQRDYGTTMQEAQQDPASQPFRPPLEMPAPPA